MAQTVSPFQNPIAEAVEHLLWDREVTSSNLGCVIPKALKMVLSGYLAWCSAL